MGQRDSIAGIPLLSGPELTEVNPARTGPLPASTGILARITGHARAGGLAGSVLAVVAYGS